jgi:uncharacterized OB-fold protein
VTEGALPRPYPEPDGETQPFWDGIAAGRLRLQRCGSCGLYVFYPRSVCPHCMSAELEWTDASGRGAVHALTVVHRAPPGFADESPYVVALIDLAEGPRMMTRLLGVEPGEAVVGMQVEVAIEGEPRLPYFRRSER